MYEVIGYVSYGFTWSNFGGGCLAARSGLIDMFPGVSIPIGVKFTASSVASGVTTLRGDAEAFLCGGAVVYGGVA